MTICTGQTLRELDFSEFESALGGNLVQVYDLGAEKVRLDSTKASSYYEINEEGLFQWRHSKDYRPDLRQVKIMLSTLDPIGMSIATEVVVENQTDEHL